MTVVCVSVRSEELLLFYSWSPEATTQLITCAMKLKQRSAASDISVLPRLAIDSLINWWPNCRASLRLSSLASCEFLLVFSCGHSFRLTQTLHETLRAEAASGGSLTSHTDDALSSKHLWQAGKRLLQLLLFHFFVVFKYKLQLLLWLLHLKNWCSTFVLIRHKKNIRYWWEKRLHDRSASSLGFWELGERLPWGHLQVHRYR